MRNIINKPHFLQMQILRELLFKPKSRFTDLNISGLSSDHFTYHIKELIKTNLVAKKEGKYSLTTKGKEMANTMDTDALLIEKQPKVAVLLIVTKLIRGKNHLLFQKRKKEPYFGYQGFITGKVRFGETMHFAANRELQEEAGLKANFKMLCIVHEHVFSVEGDLLEDKVFHVMSGTNVTGKLRTNFDAGENSWVPENKYYDIEKRYYSEDDIYDDFKKPPKKFFVERTYVVEDF